MHPIRIRWETCVRKCFLLSSLYASIQSQLKASVIRCMPTPGIERGPNGWQVRTFPRRHNDIHLKRPELQLFMQQIQNKQKIKSFKLPKFNYGLNDIYKKVILATINSGIWRVNRFLTIIIDYSKRITSTYPTHQIYGSTTTTPSTYNIMLQTWIYQTYKTSSVNISTLRRQTIFSNNMVYPITQANSRIRKWVFIHFSKWIQSDQ